MASKYRIDQSFEPADSFIGIATNLPVIQLVHFINSKTFLNLAREIDLPVYSEKTNSKNEFKFFYYEDEDFRSNFSLLANSSEGINLLPLHKQFGFFLVVYGAIPDEKIKLLITQIKSISGVQLAAIVDQEQIKALGPILQDLELHLADVKRNKAVEKKRFIPLSENQ
jgi:hypothetical protein